MRIESWQLFLWGVAVIVLFAGGGLAFVQTYRRGVEDQAALMDEWEEGRPGVAGLLDVGPGERRVDLEEGGTLTIPKDVEFSENDDDPDYDPDDHSYAVINLNAQPKGTWAHRFVPDRPALEVTVDLHAKATIENARSALRSAVLAGVTTRGEVTEDAILQAVLGSLATEEIIAYRTGENPVEEEKVDVQEQGRNTQPAD